YGVLPDGRRRRLHAARRGRGHAELRRVLQETDRRGAAEKRHLALRDGEDQVGHRVAGAGGGLRAPSPRSSRGEGWGEGLLPQIVRMTSARWVPPPREERGDLSPQAGRGGEESNFLIIFADLRMRAQH